MPEPSDLTSNRRKRILKYLIVSAAFIGILILGYFILTMPLYGSQAVKKNVAESVYYKRFRLGESGNNRVALNGKFDIAFTNNAVQIKNVDVRDYPDCQGLIGGLSSGFYGSSFDIKKLEVVNASYETFVNKFGQTYDLSQDKSSFFEFTIVCKVDGRDLEAGWGMPMSEIKSNVQGNSQP